MSDRARRVPPCTRGRTSLVSHWAASSTSTPGDHPLLEVATRIGLRPLGARTLRLRRTTLEDVWAGIEEFARDEWRIPGGLVRRPLRSGWHTQGAPGYRTASAIIGDRAGVLSRPEAAVDALVRRHHTCHGPASRQDLAWWAGVGLRVVDASLARLGEGLVSDVGPDGRAYDRQRRCQPDSACGNSRAACSWAVRAWCVT